MLHRLLFLIIFRKSVHQKYTSGSSAAEKEEGHSRSHQHPLSFAFSRRLVFGCFRFPDYRLPDHSGDDIIQFFYILQHFLHALISVLGEHLQSLFQDPVQFLGRSLLFVKEQAGIGGDQVVQVHQFPVFGERFTCKDLIPQDRYRIQIRPGADLPAVVKHHLRSHITCFPKIILIFKSFLFFHRISAVKIQQQKPGGELLLIFRRQHKNIVRTDIQMQQRMAVKRLQRPEQIAYKKDRIRKGHKTALLLHHF